MLEFSYYQSGTECKGHGPFCGPVLTIIVLCECCFRRHNFNHSACKPVYVEMSHITTGFHMWSYLFSAESTQFTTCLLNCQRTLGQAQQPCLYHKSPPSCPELSQTGFDEKCGNSPRRVCWPISKDRWPYNDHARPWAHQEENTACR